MSRIYSATQRVLISDELKKVVAKITDEEYAETPYFPTPDNIKDFKDPKSYVKWSQVVNGMMNYAIKRQECTVGPGNSYFYNPKDNNNVVNDAPVTWNGFPRRIMMGYPDNYFLIADIPGGWPDKLVARSQDEYLEWYVYRNKEGKITRIDFTCEAPEYWQSMFEWEPENCLELYQKYISPDVKMEDLKNKDGGYNVYNKWNTLHGAMHLNCPPNSLLAEVDIAADATIIREDENGEPITNSQDLINCSKFGNATRNSDPHIGITVNMMVQQGQHVSISNPVALYMMNVQTRSLTLNGESASHYMKLLRGTPERGLRYTLEVDDGVHTVSDILIAGQPIEYGGQIAMLIDMGLVAEAYQGEVPTKMYPCVEGELPDPDTCDCKFSIP